MSRPIAAVLLALAVVLLSPLGSAHAPTPSCVLRAALGPAEPSPGPLGASHAAAVEDGRAFADATWSVLRAPVQAAHQDTTPVDIGEGFADRWASPAYDDAARETGALARSADDALARADASLRCLAA